jgi:ADP-ribose pyrophosphatase YjhB (NUDIX family)
VLLLFFIPIKLVLIPTSGKSLNFPKKSEKPFPFSFSWHFAELGVNMVTEYITQVRDVFHQLLPLSQSNSKPTYTCPYCNCSSLSFSQLYNHVPLYHTNEKALSTKCQICERSVRNYAVHLHEDHDNEHQQGRSAAPLYAFSLIVCQRKSDQRFLVVQEAGSMGFWLPGGRVEVGEQLDKAAERETLEEAGVKIRITGVLKIEFTPKVDSNRLRIIFFAEPFDENNCEPKTIPDYERLVH